MGWLLGVQVLIASFGGGLKAGGSKPAAFTVQKGRALTGTVAVDEERLAVWVHHLGQPKVGQLCGETRSTCLVRLKGSGRIWRCGALGKTWGIATPPHPAMHGARVHPSAIFVQALHQMLCWPRPVMHQRQDLYSAPLPHLEQHVVHLEVTVHQLRAVVEVLQRTGNLQQHLMGQDGGHRRWVRVHVSKANHPSQRRRVVRPMPLGWRCGAPGCSYGVVEGARVRCCIAFTCSHHLQASSRRWLSQSSQRWHCPCAGGTCHGAPPGAACRSHSTP